MCSSFVLDHGNVTTKVVIRGETVVRIIVNSKLVRFHCLQQQKHVSHYCLWCYMGLSKMSHLVSLLKLAISASELFCKLSEMVYEAIYLPYMQI